MAVLDRGAVFAGCSAGAMVAADRAARPGRRAGSSWFPGLGLLANTAFGVHWDRVRFVPGLQRFVMARVPDDIWFLGIEERTAIVGDGSGWRVFGVGKVVARRGPLTRTYRAGEEFSTAAP